MKSFSFIFSLLALILLAASPAFAQGPDVGAALEQWKTAVEGGSVGEVMKLYDKKAVMISTFHQDPMVKRDDIEHYYKLVLGNPDVHVDITATHPRIFGNLAINDGSYTLSYTQDGESVVTPARFSFVYMLEGGKWMIIDHHSSRVPLGDVPR